MTSVLETLRRAALVGCFTAVAAAGSVAAEVQVAVAANFSAPMRLIAAAFERDTGHKALLAVGATGAFYAQVRNGAPFDVLLAADEATPARLEADGAAVPGSRFTYAIGRLVLWSAQPGLVDDRGEVLRSPAANRLALADPKLAPYGAAAMQALQRLGLADAWRGRIVQGENIAQAHQIVASGQVALGFVAASQVRGPAGAAPGSAWAVPQALYDPIRQDAVLLARGRDNPAAVALMRWLRGDEARRVIADHGYGF